MALEDDPEYQALPNKQKMFLFNLLSGKNATDSYALAYPKANRKSAGQHGYELKKRFSNIIERNSPILVDKIEKVANETLHNLTLMAFADIGNMFDENNQLKSIHDMPKSLRMAVTEVEVEGDKIKYKMGGRIKALEILSKVARLHNEQPEMHISLITEEERDSKIKEIVLRAQARRDDDVGEE